MLGNLWYVCLITKTDMLLELNAKHEPKVFLSLNVPKDNLVLQNFLKSEINKKHTTNNKQYPW